MATRSQPEQVHESYRSLHCTACGAGNRLPDDVVEVGAYECRHCGSLAIVPGAGAFAIEGPRGEVVRIVRPGSSELRVSSGDILPPHWAFGIVVLVDLGVGAVVSLIRTQAPAVGVWLTPVSLGAVALLAALAVWVCAAQQRLRIVDGRADLSWTSFGWTRRRRRIAFERARTRSRVWGRDGVAFDTPHGGFFLWVWREDSMRWLERQLRAALKDVRAAGGDVEVACPGCGGPVGSERQLRDARGLECPHCRTGLVQTGRGWALPPVKVSQDVRPSDVPDGPGEPRRVGKALEWHVPAFAASWPKSSPLVLLTWIALVAGAVVGAWIVVPRLTALQGLGTFVAVALTLGGAWTTWYFLGLYYARHVIRLDDHALSHEMILAGRRHQHVSVPLARVLTVHGSSHRFTYDGEEVHGPAYMKVELTTATGGMTVELWTHRGVMRALFAALPERLEALGRGIARAD